jgi:hypothetical protein
MGDEGGSILPFAVILLLLFVLAALPFLSAGYLEGTRWYVQRAADAAALAGAGRQVIQTQTDARGIVYCETVAVDPVAGPQAAATYWASNTVSQPSLVTQSFSAVPSGGTITVQATVQAPGGALILVGQPDVNWSVLAEAQAQNTSGLPNC